MSVIQKAFFTVESRNDPEIIGNPPLGDPELLITYKPVATEIFPAWFRNASIKYNKIVRVLGATVYWIDKLNVFSKDPVPLNGGYRLFSNISTNSNIVMKTTIVKEDSTKIKSQEKEGFVMMVNNYNSTKEFDITYDNINEVQFFLRPWHTSTSDLTSSPIDFVCELELLLVTRD